MEEKTRYSDDELKEFEAIIDQKLAKAEEELNYYLNQIKELAENDGTKVKGLDDGQGTIESTRISNKVYGICRETGKLISKARLKAVPHATLSIEAKQKQAPRV
jgi:DnaK suppressor protein